MKSKKILIVEDDLIIAESHKDRLEEFGFANCKIAVTPEEAMIVLEESKYDLVLLDVRLRTHFEGIDLGNKIAQQFRIPFIYLTAHADFESIKKMVASKPIAYLSKPIRKTDLYAAVSIVFSMNDANPDIVSLKDGGSFIRFDRNSLIYAQSSGNYINLKFAENHKSKLIRMSLDTLLSELNDKSFVRISRFYVVNLKFITEFNRKHILINGEKLSIAKDKIDEIQAFFTL